MVFKQQLHTLFDYKEGMLFWKISRSPVFPGKRAGCLCRHRGYRYIRINYKLYAEHNLIWIYHNGDIPEGFEVDHRDRNKLNNKLENLRLATRTQNNGNRDTTYGTSQFKGVYFDKQTGKWRAEIRYQKKRKRLGRFLNELDAAKAYDRAAKELFGEFAKCNTLSKPG